MVEIGDFVGAVAGVVVVVVAAAAVAALVAVAEPHTSSVVDVAVAATVVGVAFVADVDVVIPL